MCIIAIKKANVNYPSFQRVKNMCENNNDGFAIVWKAKDEPVRNYRTLNEKKFLKKYKEITSTHKAKDVTMFIHARIKTHGTQRVENCHGWIEDKIGMAFAHNGILQIKNREDMTDSETFFRDIFAPVFEVGGWSAGELAIKAIIGTSKFCFMDMYGNISHYGQYITGDDGVLYSNTSYEENRWSYLTKHNSMVRSYSYPRYDTRSNNVSSKKTDNYDEWFNSEEYWNTKKVAAL